MADEKATETVDAPSVPKVKKKAPIGFIVVVLILLALALTAFIHSRLMVEAKGKAMVAAMQMTNETILQTDQPAGAGNFLKALLTDKNVVYVVLTDEQGNPKAFSDLKMADSKFDVPNGKEMMILKEKAVSKDADFEIIGPITSASGTRIGTVRLGMKYSKR